ncbi:hypothetical protein MHK_007841 [Candidatus Magnetomorum sp. HK-1]|nr:hypothetical protein MHK_007841 [Candidatus Magnetomorum sp. HK-1]
MNEKIISLIKEIEKNIAITQKLMDYYLSYIQKNKDKNQTEKAIIIGDIIVKYYTCLETTFLRISQFFENSLKPEKWHQDLLNKMTLHLDGIRDAVISENSYNVLLELLKFRHFQRYFFDISYDPDKIAYLEKKLIQINPMILKDLNLFIQYLKSIE